MKAYGVELRQRVLDDCDQGMTEAAAVEKWKVSRQWIQKIKKQRRETGSIEPKKGKTGPKLKLAPYEKEVRQMVADHPDTTPRPFARLCGSRRYRNPAANSRPASSSGSPSCGTSGTAEPSFFVSHD